MFILILVVIAILAVVGLLYGMILSSRQEDVRGWVAESVSNWRSENLGVEDFEVQMNDASLGELFAAFPEDETAYYTPEDVSSQINRVVDAEKGAVAQVKPRLPKVKTAKATRARRVKSA
ncbi:hypothetical protein A4H34_09860 [Peptidiphaga gingivicola]|uniref:Uncharacterized protein n=1 Tax=Peptidiphaga gingivicola TaxID=2741497 RepID=A0A179B243_9ACTO|nr:hypothetical protein [Peptidiphaga gingivicola]OAP85389.1 hypothetical protein A4H34_09860 [Peptidiphaga gingivicola]